MRSFLILFFCLIPLIGNCKKVIEIPQNRTDSLQFNYIQKSLEIYDLDDLTLSEDSLRMRIWMGDNIAELKVTETFSANLILSIRSDKQSTPILKAHSFDSAIAERLCDSLIHEGILNLKEDRNHGIDGYYYLFEISTPDKYRLYSYWSPWTNRSESNSNIVPILSHISTLLDIRGYQQDFYDGLESGIYHKGMSGFRKDQFLADSIKKSSLYEYIEERMRTELQMSEQTDYLKYPLLVVDNQIVFLSDINNLEYTQVKKITILASDDISRTALYGTSGANGVIIIDTK